MEKIELCSNRCCPTISTVGDIWFINDDYGGEIKLTTEQLDKLIEIRSQYQKISTSNKVDNGRLPIQS